MHSTNYTNAFIEVADDCKAQHGTMPPDRQPATIARLQYDMIHAHPYRHTSDDVVFGVHAARQAIGGAELAASRAVFFSKGQACLRASPLAKQYGWGIHHDADGKVALYARESAHYDRLRNDPALKHVKAMKNSRPV